MIVTHAHLGDFVHMANVYDWASAKSMCTIAKSIANSSYKCCRLHRFCCQWTSGSRRVHTFQTVYTSTVQLAQTGKVKFTQHSTILLAALWLVKVSRTFYAVVLLLVNPLTLWSFHYNIELNQAQQKANWRYVRIRLTYPASRLFVFGGSRGNWWICYLVNQQKKSCQVSSRWSTHDLCDDW